MKSPSPNVIYGLHAGDFKIRYVGRTTKTADARLAGHRKGAHLPPGRYRSTYVCKWMREVGPEVVQIAVLEEVEDPGLLPEREMYWIARHRAMGSDLLNRTDGGTSDVPCDETRQLMSVARKMYWTEERKAEMSAKLKGRTTQPLSAETKAKLSEALKGRPCPSSRRSAHTRWHTNRGVVKEECEHCQQDHGPMA